MVIGSEDMRRKKWIPPGQSIGHAMQYNIKNGAIFLLTFKGEQYDINFKMK